MKSTLACTRAVMVLTLCAAAAAAGAQTVCTRPHLTQLESLACEKGRDDIDSLRQYAWRTRMIYNLYLPHYAPERATLPRTQAQPREAPRETRRDVQASR